MGLPRNRLNLWLLPAALLLALLLPPPGQAAVCTGFRPARQDTRSSPPILARPIAALPADFNRDGILDLAAVNKSADGTLLVGSISVFTRTSDGMVALASTQMAEGFSQWAAVGEFNNDGFPDVAAVTIDSAMIFLGDGSGGFQPFESIPVPFDPTHVSVADMDADRNSDLVVVQQYIGQPNGRVTVLRGNGAGGFTLMTPAPVGQDSRGGVTGDFNKDGALDVVSTSFLSGIVSFLPGLGNGNFGPRVNSPLGVSGSSYVAAADFDSDSMLDLVVTTEETGTSVIFARGLGDGTFQVTGTAVTGFTPRNPVVCDFDHNGIVDVAVPNSGSNAVSMLFGDGNGGFSQPFNVGTDLGPEYAAVTDLNADGFCDVVTANGANSISSLMGGVRGTLGTPTVSVGRAPVGAATADFNRDGNLDLAVVNRDDGTLSLYRGDGEGGIFLSQTAAVGINPGSVAAADFNADGYPDLVVANQGIPADQLNDTIDVLYNDTTGGFVLTHTLTVGDLPLDVKTGDFNGDGLHDIAVANSRSDKVSFYFAEPSNQFGNVKSIRIGQLQRSLALGDYNSDNLLDAAISLNQQNVMTVLLGTSQGSFQAGPTIDLGGTSRIDYIVSGHLNADLVPDLAVISQSSDPFGAGELTTLLGTGVDGLFQQPYAPVPTGRVPEGLAILDLDRSGGLDVIVANRLENDIIVFHGDGTGRFTSGDRFGTGSDPLYLVTGDFNGDFRSDIATVDFGGNDVSVLLNNSPIADQIDSVFFTSNERFIWSAVPGASSYKVYRDLLRDLAPDNFGKCLASSLDVAEFNDPSVPLPGDAYFYLLSVVTGGLEGPLGYSSNCVSRPNFNPCFLP